jgi:hypothetical protein
VRGAGPDSVGAAAASGFAAAFLRDFFGALSSAITAPLFFLSYTLERLL